VHRESSIPEGREESVFFVIPGMVDGNASKWRDLRAPAGRLRLAPTLLSGMSFRWLATPSRSFVGVLGDTIYELRETETGTTEFRTHGSRMAHTTHVSALWAHLSLDRGPDAAARGGNACGRDACGGVVAGGKLAAAAAQHGRCAAVLPGVRVLAISSYLEALVTFVGSANNNIKRNMQMVEALCAAFPTNVRYLPIADAECHSS
jgi:hypothetical protein